MVESINTNRRLRVHNTFRQLSPSANVITGVSLWPIGSKTLNKLSLRIIVHKVIFWIVNLFAIITYYIGEDWVKIRRKIFTLRVQQWPLLLAQQQLGCQKTTHTPISVVTPVPKLFGSWKVSYHHTTLWHSVVEWKFTVIVIKLQLSSGIFSTSPDTFNDQLHYMAIHVTHISHLS